jgi:hypothetical protein
MAFPDLQLQRKPVTPYPIALVEISAQCVCCLSEVTLSTVPTAQQLSLVLHRH